MAHVRAKLICLVGFMVLVLAGMSGAQQRPPILEKIAKAYGLDSYGQIDAIRYSWNGEIPGLFQLAHVWEWEPKTGKISFEGKGHDGKPVKVNSVNTQPVGQPAIIKNDVEAAVVTEQ